ncbi:hypothetical protein H5410_034644 [Solanum commersonii]|uniref:DUF8040 domain-containing protein n=1 Tax=Solanum commersonii TaxID=4109 RepID=A0A9J5YSA8_SOLCO|nr:hypothetical protein H5410_034644 [Solanum commersonii]
MLGKHFPKRLVFLKSAENDFRNEVCGNHFPEKKSTHNTSEFHPSLHPCPPSNIVKERCFSIISPACSSPNLGFPLLFFSFIFLRYYMPWQIFLLCSFLCYIINAITLYWSLEQMDMTNKDEDDAIVGAVATSVLAFGVAINVAYNNQSSIPREPYTNKDQEREFYMNSILNGSDVHCIGQIRMSKHVFYELCNALRRNNLLCSTKNMSIQEQVLIFLEIVGFNERFRKIGSHFYRSIKSIHRCFHTVLQAVLKLNPILIKPSDGMQTLLNKSGLGWDDNLKMITASPTVYAMHIQADPSHDKFINKKIDMFEEMSLVCGNDRARGDCAKSFEDIGLDCSSEKGNEDEIEGPSKENGVQDVSETSQVKSSRKRNRPSDVQDVVAAISKIADSRLDVTRLYEEVMAIEGYGEEFLGDAFDYLVQSDTLAKGLMAKNQNLCKVWLERFKGQHK